jgi:hypothetical protein
MTDKNLRKTNISDDYYYSKSDGKTIQSVGLEKNILYGEWNYIIRSS